MKRIHTTNILLGIIAAEVVFLTARAVSRRHAATEMSFHPAPPRSSGQARESSSAEGLLDRAARAFRNLFNGPAAGLTRGTRPGEENRVIPQADFDPSGAEPAHLKGDMRGLTEKLQDPAWSGALAANAGNISLTDAERAVPMPGSAHLVQRLDRNPFIGGGMRDHSRDHI